VYSKAAVPWIEDAKGNRFESVIWNGRRVLVLVTAETTPVTVHSGPGANSILGTSVRFTHQGYTDKTIEDRSEPCGPLNKLARNLVISVRNDVVSGSCEQSGRG